MKHIQSYKDFENIDEKLTKNQRTILNIPKFLGAFIGKKLFGIVPLLNMRWKETKGKTQDSHYYPLIADHSYQSNKMDCNLEKIKLGDLASKNIKPSMFLRGWNIYMSDKRIKDGYKSDKNSSRRVVYISKDEIKKGDTYLGERVSDWDVYGDEFRKNDKVKDEYPVIILIAKFDNIDKSKELSQYVDDICLDLEDNFGVSVEPKFNYQQDRLGISIKPVEGNKLVFSDDLASQVNSMVSRVVEYLKTEKMTGFNTEIFYKVKRTFVYHTSPDDAKGRFKELIKNAETYDRRNDSSIYDSYTQCLDISSLSNHYSEDFKIREEDLRVLMGDLKNCYDNYSGPDRNRNKPVTEIKLDYISIIIKK